jgi:predicted nuclease of predicted toxin-antitoxin system
MKVLIDECAPRALKRVLAEHEFDCLTVQEAGWSGTVNGELLNLAELQFDALLTLDSNVKYQQNMSGRRIAIVILRARSNRLPDLIPHISDCVRALRRIKPGEIVYVGLST